MGKEACLAEKPMVMVTQASFPTATKLVEDEEEEVDQLE